MEQFAIKARIREMNEYTEVFLAVERGEVEAGINTKVNGLVLEGRFPNIEPTTIYFSPMKIRSAVPKGRHGSIISILDTNFATLKVDKNSFYYQSLEKWMGVYLRKTVFPSWLPWALGGLGGLLLFFLGASIVFRHKVKGKTQSLLAANQELFRSQEILSESEGTEPFSVTALMRFC